ncbi:MBOAT family O-acyltransferase [Campylobacter aviculae]|uniref:MBOAT family protein n=1 Tax=Campylobacter aviculae TaxID=2510190 RepID=A0A4V6DWD8_9BACT|nr:MBOAT family O-acyltransferase [Campylobacter aviculae]TKX31432.1 MBOAT family protein [Campylobacter aviculae]
MLFSSYVFIFAFLPVTLIGFYILKAYKFYTSAKVFLALASLFFYGYFKVEYIFILAFSTITNYFLASWILRKDHGEGYKLLCLGITFNLILLGVFKYTDFFLENFNLFSKLINLDFNIPLPHILLPLGISFFTFQKIAFLVDCYKKVNIDELSKKKKIDFIDFCLFVSFFPQLIAGPIVHHKEMMPQFHSLLNKNNSLVNWELMAKGLFIFSIGFFKKIFIADNFAVWANAGFKVVQDGSFLNIFEAWVTSLSYTFQLYFDFSGYCDMAIGLALFFGITLPSNFNSPYKALNIADFWRRWHITLGRFLKDYLYIPLGGNRAGKIINLRNLFIVAFVSGVWHGSGWGFVIWGILHALAMVSHRIYSFYIDGKKFLNSKIYKFLAWFITFNFINITWIFFRSENLTGAINLLKSMFGIVWVELPHKFYKAPDVLKTIGGNDKTIGFFIVAFILCLVFKNSIDKTQNLKINYKSAIFTAFLIFVALTTLIYAPYVEFIYFNF